jgi:histone acetyltransferase MYST1
MTPKPLQRKASEESAHISLPTSQLPQQNTQRIHSKEAQLISLEKEHEEVTKVKNIPCIALGKYEIDTWYFSPYPDEYAGDELLYICEYCLKYMRKHKTLQRHALKCANTSPPGKYNPFVRWDWE